MSKQLTLVRSKIFNPLSRTHWESIEDGALLFNTESGRIEAVGEYSLLKNNPEISTTLDFSDYLVMPGMVDTHTHLPQLPIRGKTAGTLLEWLTRYAFPVEEAFAEENYARSLSRLFFHRLLANGTTTALVFSSVHEASTDIAFEAAQEAGLRVIMGKSMMDRNVPTSMLEGVEESINASMRLASKWHGKNNDLLRYAFTPRFALSCTEALLKASAELCRQFPQSYLQSHLAENVQEIQQVKQLFGNTLSYTQVYEKTGCLSDRTIMAHAIHLSDDELGILKQTDTRLAHCPSSNFFLKSGCFNLPAILQSEIRFGLGTDIGAGPDFSMFRVMRAMDEMQLNRGLFVTPTEALHDATLGGAKALSLESETGNLTPGKSADFIVVDTEELNPLEGMPSAVTEVLSQLVYLGGEQHIVKTFVRGREIYARPTLHL